VAANNLGVLAAEHYERALRIKESLLGPDHPDVAMTVHNLAVLRTTEGRREEAEALYRRALAIFERALGPDHPKTAACRAELAKLRRATP
jgi:eukaryotic-like serine/threonine-protein kinase